MKKLLVYLLLIAAISLLALGIHSFKASESSDTQACNLKGEVVRVADGDSITVVDQERKSHKIRLAGIDTPERQQPYGKVARQFLAKQVFKKQVCVGWYKRDKYKRLVGIVRVTDEDINLKILRVGLGWHYKQYQHEQSKTNRIRYAEAQESAEDAKLGLWQDRSSIPPWLWRRGER